jgi:hypothetical protein
MLGRLCMKRHQLTRFNLAQIAVSLTYEEALDSLMTMIAPREVEIHIHLTPWAQTTAQRVRSHNVVRTLTSFRIV